MRRRADQGEAPSGIVADFVLRLVSFIAAPADSAQPPVDGRAQGNHTLE
jgi:hypothetical protein